MPCVAPGTSDGPMLSAAEVRRSLNGAALLFRGRADGLQFLDRSVGGFWSSFAALLLVLPIDAISILAQSRIVVQEPFVSAFVDRLPPLILDWIAFPIVLGLFAKTLGISGAYVSYVVARNWAAPISWTIVTVPLVLQGAGFIGGPVAIVVTVAALAVAMRYHYLILRIALGATMPMAAMLLVGDVVLSFFIVGLFG